MMTYSQLASLIVHQEDVARTFQRAAVEKRKHFTNGIASLLQCQPSSITLEEIAADADKDEQQIDPATVLTKKGLECTYCVSFNEIVVRIPVLFVPTPNGPAVVIDNGARFDLQSARGFGDAAARFAERLEHYVRHDGIEGALAKLAEG